MIETLSEEDWEKGLQLKFMGYVRCLRHALPIMVKQGGGRVVNLIGNDGVKPSYWEIVPGAANAASKRLLRRAFEADFGTVLGESLPLLRECLRAPEVAAAREAWRRRRGEGGR